jgi:hypothetical protein
VAVGTAIAYLRNARDDGSRPASDLLAQTVEVDADQTQRFMFSPGELEELATRNRK